MSDTSKTFPKYQGNPLLIDLPDYLKDPKTFEPVQRQLLETLACPKLHSDPSEMFTCKTCTENMVKRRELMSKLGFKSPQQYLEWKKVHTEIKDRMPLDMYNRMIEKDA